jgi:DNA polymerase III subunit alpha
MSFFSLQNYTTYSVTSGLLEPDLWVDRARELDYPALGISDKGNLGGHIEFQMLCEAADIQPIFGAEYRLVDDCTSKEKQEDRGAVLVYIKDEVGHKNLVGLNNFAWTKVDDGGGFYYRNRIDAERLAQFSEGLILIIPSNDGAFIETPMLWAEFVGQMSEAFGDDLYLGYNPADESTIELCEKRIYPMVESGLGRLVPVYNCHYPRESDAHLYEVIRKVDNNRRHMKKNFDREVVDGFLPDPIHDSIMWETLEDIASKCTYRYSLGTYFMPHPDLPVTGRLEAEIAWHLVLGIDQKLHPGFSNLEDWKTVLLDSENPIETVCQHLDRVGGEPYEWALKYGDSGGTPPGTMTEYAERLRHESGIIEKLGFLDYFLIVRDICTFVDDQGEERGPARGSAAGSLFSYLLNITKVDPLEFDLLFERFLNEDRADLPDIDLDFSAEGRAAIKQYILDKYGEEHVISIGAYDRMKIASAVNMVAKAYGLGIPDNKGEIVHYDDRLLTQKLSQHVTATSRGEDELRERLEDPTFRNFYERHQNWFDTVIMPLCETIVTTSRHAAGTLITAFPINECMPIYTQGGNINTQWRDRHCEKRGFPKFDILGIKAVDIISYCKKLVREQHGEELPPIEHVPLNDPATIQIYCEGRTDGVFQAKSFIAKHFYRDLAPEDFWDITNGTALNRPGPIDAGAPGIYNQIKRGEVLPEYDTPDMIPITEKTKGLVIYQEQMMEVVKEIGQLSPVEADYVRKACGKKKFDEMAKWEGVFHERGLAAGYNEEVLHTLWTKVNAFAGYGFNASHAVSYSLIGYNHAWIKARYPTEFWCAALKYASPDAKRYDSVFNLKARAREEGINFNYPTLFGFAEDFTPAGENQIYWPIHAIKGIGDKTTELVTDHGRRTKFESLDDMIETLGPKCDLGIYKKLIRAGFFSPLHEDPWVVTEIVFERRNALLGKKDTVPYDMTSEDKLDWIRLRNDAFGFIVEPWKNSGQFHPKVMRLPETTYQSIPRNTKLFVGGYVEDVKIKAHKPTKRNPRNNDRFYAVIKLVDEGEEFKIMCWADFWMNSELDYSNDRPMRGDLIELIGYKDVWSPDDSDKEIHQIKTKPDSHMRKIWSAH